MPQAVHFVVPQGLELQVEHGMNTGTLYVVATPIGNLEDLSPRARKILGDVSLIAAEDTRVTGRLLSHFGIKCRQISLHDYNEDSQSTKLVAALSAGQSIALVSDAGTPLISDPGYRLLFAAHRAGVKVVPVPGPSSLLSALCVSGLPTDRFCFEGFLPAKATARRARLQELAGAACTQVFFESVHRVVATLEDCNEIFGSERPAFVGRELTKLHEQCVAGSMQELLAMAHDGRLTLKGEFVLAIAGDAECRRGDTLGAARQMLTVLAEELPGKQAVALAARISGHNKNELYALMLEMKDSAGT